MDVMMRDPERFGFSSFAAHWPGRRDFLRRPAALTTEFLP
jgi:hypothetical protein